MKRIEPAQLSLAQTRRHRRGKTPAILADAFEERFGIRPQEGYGLTETSPATNVNLPDPHPEYDAVVIPSSRPARSARCSPASPSASPIPPPTSRCPSTNKASSGFKGANIFPGYLINPKNPPKS
jgi:acyl-[acyl-carrier-protein]-phospholipid O-acyltransferase / long-chain-fatty-acid--[acyl-carrier-protein] ligase